MIKKVINSTTIPVIIMLVLSIILLCISGCNNHKFFDYQSVYASEDSVLVRVWSNDIDRPLAAWYFAEQQAKKFDAIIIEVEPSISISWSSYGWSWGKSQEKQEYTYHYTFYMKKKGIKK